MASNPLKMRAHLGIAAGCLDPVRPTSSPTPSAVVATPSGPPSSPSSNSFLDLSCVCLGRLLAFHFPASPSKCERRREAGEKRSRGVGGPKVGDRRGADLLRHRFLDEQFLPHPISRAEEDVRTGRVVLPVRASVLASPSQGGTDDGKRGQRWDLADRSTSEIDDPHTPPRRRVHPGPDSLPGIMPGLGERRGAGTAFGGRGGIRSGSGGRRGRLRRQHGPVRGHHEQREHDEQVLGRACRD